MTFRLTGTNGGSSAAASTKSSSSAHPERAAISAPEHQTSPAQRRSPLAFFALTVALFAPFPVLATFVHVPGLLKNAPVTDFFAAFVPAAAALILVYRAEGAAGVRRLLHRVVDYGRIADKLWYLPVVLLPVVSLGASCTLMVATGWQFHRQAELPATTMLLFVPVFLAAAVGEELGWSGYVIEPLQHRFGALGGNLVLAVPWYGLHLPSILYSGLYGPTLIVLGLVGALGFRVLWGWLFNNTGHSVFAIIVVHAVTNMCTAYVPGVPTAANAPLLVALAVLVTLLWGPRTLSRFRLPVAVDPPVGCSRSR